MHLLAFIANILMLISSRSYVIGLYKTAIKRKAFGLTFTKVVKGSSVQSETFLTGTVSDNGSTILGNGFSKLGLIPELIQGLNIQGSTYYLIIAARSSRMTNFITKWPGLNNPTAVQKVVIPRLINGENLVMAASTGSGKTLAYMLPAIQSLLIQETNGYDRQIRRPR